MATPFSFANTAPTTFPPNKFANSQPGPQGGHQPFKSPRHTPSATREKDPRLKKPLNSFMVFLRERRKASNESRDTSSISDTKGEATIVNQRLGAEWKAMTREQKAPYQSMAESEKVAFYERHPEAREMQCNWNGFGQRQCLLELQGLETHDS